MIDGKVPDDMLLQTQLQSSEISTVRKRPTNGHAGAARTILFIDEQQLTRDCLSEIIGEQCPDFQVSGLRINEFDAHRTRSDVALIILNLHDAPLSAASHLSPPERRHDERPPILVITNREESPAMIEAMQQDVAGLMRSDSRIDLLIAAIRLVMAGGRYYPTTTLASLMRKSPLITSSG